MDRKLWAREGRRSCQKLSRKSRPILGWMLRPSIYKGFKRLLKRKSRKLGRRGRSRIKKESWMKIIKSMTLIFEFHNKY
jgi:hypothetical protein